jgi:hypothetical protein
VVLVTNTPFTGHSPAYDETIVLSYHLDEFIWLWSSLYLNKLMPALSLQIEKGLRISQ